MALIHQVATPCPTFQVGARGLSITLPGGAVIGVQSQDIFTTNAELCRLLLGQLQGVMAPMAPLFTMVQGVLCLKDIVTSIPEAIVTLDPTKITETIERCTPTIEKLLSLIPQISAPAMLASVLDVLICVLNGTIDELEICVQKTAAINALQSRVQGPNDPLTDIIACAAQLTATRQCAVIESLGPLDVIIELVNVFMEMIGQDPIEGLGEATADATALIEQLRDFITPLRIVRMSLGGPLLVAVPKC
jgi:hypothetical protein